jgi:hypothetical protein
LADHIKLKHFEEPLKDYIIPENNEVLKFFLNLLSIIDICMSRSISEEERQNLQTLVTTYFEIRDEVLKQLLKFKHHNLVHYTELIKIIGPLVNILCTRLEGKHKEIKAYALENNNRKNLHLMITKETLVFSIL